MYEFFVWTVGLKMLNETVSTKIHLMLCTPSLVHHSLDS